MKEIPLILYIKQNKFLKNHVPEIILKITTYIQERFYNFYLDDFNPLVSDVH